MTRINATRNMIRLEEDEDKTAPISAYLGRKKSKNTMFNILKNLNRNLTVVENHTQETVVMLLD